MTSTTATTTILLPISAIVPWKHNVRGEEKFTEAALAELIASLKRYGQKHAATVRKHPTEPDVFQIADGQRRWHAMQFAGIKEIEVRVRELDDAQMFEMVFSSGAEGLTVPLTPLEEARGYRDAMNVVGCSIYDFAKRFVPERDETHVYRRLALLNLEGEAKKALESGELPASSAAAIGMIPDEAQRKQVAEFALKYREMMGVKPRKEIERHIRDNVYVSFRRALFKPDDAALTAAGACTGCEFYEKAEKVGTPGTCRRPSCFKEKTLAVRAKIVAREVAAGKHALTAAENEAIYPAALTAISSNSGYVEYNRPPPLELLKKEVVAQGRTPPWKELCEGKKASVKVYVAWDQQGRLVDIVKLAEALLAADANESAIFNTETIKRYQLSKPKPGAGAPAAPEPKSARRAPEEPRDDDDGEAEYTEEGGQSTSEALPPAPAANEAAVENAEMQALRALARDMGEWIKVALERYPEMPPRARTEGFQFLRLAGVATVAEVKPQPAGDGKPFTKDTATLAEWVKARAAGMELSAIAASYGVPIEDVAGALGESAGKQPDTAPPAKKPARAPRPKRTPKEKIPAAELEARVRALKASGLTYADIVVKYDVPRTKVKAIVDRINAGA